MEEIMKYCSIATTNASRVAQGCMRIGGMTANQIDTLIKTDLECGINFFDHAFIYGGGACEKKFGEFLAANPSLRDQMLIQTKVGIRDGIYDSSKETILSMTDTCLQRLGVDYVDFLLIHRPDALVEPEEVAQAFDKLYAEGKVRHFGVSNHNSYQIELLNKYLGEDNPVCVNQLQFSPTNTTMIDAGVNVNMENEGAINRDGSVLDYCRLKNITIQPWSPFQYGFFAGVFLDNPKFPKLNEVINAMAEKYGTTNTGMVVSWILRHPAKMQPIIGTTTIGRIRQIAQASDVDITREDWYAIYKAAGNNLP